MSAAFAVMRELRPDLNDEQFNRLHSTSCQEGYRLVALFDGDECRAAAGYRLLTNFVSGRHIYVDDLVTGGRWRSQGYGRLLNEHLLEVARREGCTSVQLDSATHRRQAHRFYLRERYEITAFHFTRVFEQVGDRR